MKKITAILILTLCLISDANVAFAKKSGGLLHKKPKIHDEIVLKTDTAMNLNLEGAQDEAALFPQEYQQMETNLQEGITEEPSEPIGAKVQIWDELANFLNEDILTSTATTPILQDRLRFYYEEGPIDSLTFFGAYKGSISASFLENGYHTEYDTGFLDVGVKGKFKDDCSDFKFMVNLKPQEDRTFFQNLLSDVYIATNRIPHHRVLLGNSRSPIGMEGGTSSYALPFIARSQIARNFGSVRAFGLKVIGNWDLIEYNLGGYSSDRFFTNFFPGMEFTGWLNFKPLGKTDGRWGSLTVGGGLNAGNRNGNYTVGGAYAEYRYKKMKANFEYAIADGSNGIERSYKQAEGFYTTLSYDITEKIQVLARFDQFDPNRNISGDLRREYSAGVNYFVRGEALRLSLNYVFYELENEANGQRIFLSTQILL